MSHETNSPVMQVVAKMQDQFHSYGVNVTLEPVLYIRSETFLMFRVKLGEGAKMKTVFHCAEDIRIAMNLAQFYPFVKWNQLFLAVYKTKTLKNSLQRMLESPTFQQQGDKMLIALGYDIINAMVFEDLTQMTHVLYAGATNSGKSFGLVSFMVSLMVGQPVSKVNFVVLDIGGSTLDVFENTPHLSHPIVTDVDTGVKVIGAVTQEMNRRIEAGWEVVKTLPHIVCVIDEFALFMDTMMKHPDGIDVKNQISDLLRRGISLSELVDCFGILSDIPADVKLSCETEIRYAGYLKRSRDEAERAKKMEQSPLPADIDYFAISGLRLEAREKLDRVRPLNLGQAERISGVSPADISVLMVYLSMKK